MLNVYSKLIISLAFFPVVLIAMLLWTVMLVMFITPLIILFGYKKLTGVLSYNSKTIYTQSNESNVDLNRQVQSREYECRIVFDRIDDVSKILGCNTRNVQYRWDIFTKALTRLQKNNATKVLRGLDFGAGSLRDTYHLSGVGFEVDAIDVNIDQLKGSYEKYDWSQVRCKPWVQGISGVDLAKKHGSYDLILAFDVMEHCIELDHTIEELRNNLSENGLLFISVPNRLTLFERFFAMQHRSRIRKGITDNSGIPHVNFMTPSEWKQFFSNKGFAVNDHDMVIGFFVNDVWHGLFTIPIRIFVEPILKRLASLSGLTYKACSFETMFYPRWLMKFVNELDETKKKYLKERWAWNLFVLSHRN